jgi:hypothetical protein
VLFILFPRFNLELLWMILGCFPFTSSFSDNFFCQRDFFNMKTCSLWWEMSPCNPYNWKFSNLDYLYNFRFFFPQTLATLAHFFPQKLFVWVFPGIFFLVAKWWKFTQKKKKKILFFMTIPKV